MPSFKHWESSLARGSAKSSSQLLTSGSPLTDMVLRTTPLWSRCGLAMNMEKGKSTPLSSSNSSSTQSLTRRRESELCLAAADATTEEGPFPPIRPHIRRTYTRGSGIFSGSVFDWATPRLMSRKDASLIAPVKNLSVETTLSDSIVTFLHPRNRRSSTSLSARTISAS